MSKTGLPWMNVYVANSEFGETIPLAVGTSSISATFFLLPSKNNASVIVTNAGSKIAFINFGDSTKGTVTATAPALTGTTGATPILPSAIYTFQKNSDALKADTCAAICGGTDSTTLYFTSVQGS